MTSDEILAKFKTYRTTHPQLANLWIGYLGLKKRHSSALLAQAQNVLTAFEKGHPDWAKKDILSLLLYKRAMRI